MKRILLVCFALFVCAGAVLGQSFEEAARRRDAAIQKQRENKEQLIDGGWDDALIHGSAYGLVGEGFGGGLNFDWQPFRNFAWTFIDVNYFRGGNVSSLAMATWRPFFLEVAIFAGPGVSFSLVDPEPPPQDHGGSYSYSSEKELKLSFLFVAGGTIGIHLGPGTLLAGMTYYSLHGPAFSLGYKLMGPTGR